MVETLKIEILNTGHITNCYLYYNDTKEAFLVDAPDKAEYILKEIEKRELKLKYILLTHAHIDHTYALDEIRKKTGAKVLVNEKDVEMLIGKIDDSSAIFSINQLKRDEKDYVKIKDKDIIKLGSIQVEVISTPGHTKGSTSYFVKEENILFTGDALFCDCVGRWDLETGSLDDTINTVVKLYTRFKKSGTLIYPGHGNFAIDIRQSYFPVSRIIFNSSGVDLDTII